MALPASRILRATCLPLALLLSAAGAGAQTVKVGIAGPFSGPFAHYGKLFKDGAEAYVASQGGKLAGHDIEFLYRDTGGPNPAGTKNLAQELIVKDKVDYLGGFVFTPNAFAVAPLIQESKTPTVIFNAATSNITTKSDYFIRTSYTLWQVTVPMAQHAYKKGVRKVVTAVTDYAPGVDAENSFKAEFGKLGGQVVESIRMPIRTTDFAPFAQRIKASGAEAVYVFLPGGPPNLGFVKAYNENGLRQVGVEFLGTAEMDEFDLQKFGESALGLSTAFHYSAAHDSEENRKFLAALAKQSKETVANYASVGAWDGMYVIHQMIEATGGKRDGDKAIAAAKALKWESPRGPVSIEPESRHITQHVYLRTVEKSGDRLINKEMQSFGPQVDHGLGQVAVIAETGGSGWGSDLTLFTNILIDGLSYGMVLFVIAVGLSVTLGLMRFINLAHGAFAMTGGYVAAWLIRVQGIGFVPGVLLAVLVTGLLGAVLEVLVLRRLYRRSELEQVLFTIGLTFLFVATANLLFGPEVQLIPLPPWLAGTVEIGMRTLPAQRLLVIAAGTAVLAGSLLLLSRTRFGIWLRATVDNTGAAASLGIPVQLVYALTFAAGAALAGLGGILGAELMPLEPYYPVKYLVLVLVIVAVGGMGSIAGSAAAALALGTIETASKYLASEYGSLFFFVAMALLLAWRPHGLLGRH